MTDLNWLSEPVQDEIALINSDPQVKAKAFGLWLRFVDEDGYLDPDEMRLAEAFAFAAAAAFMGC